MPKQVKQSIPKYLAMVVLTLLVWAVYWPVVGFEFVEFDTGALIVDNPHIRVETGAGRLLLIGVALAAAGIYWVTR